MTLRSVIRENVSMLLGILLSIVIGWQAGVASFGGQSAPPACHCCNVDRSDCATPACCAASSNDRTPVAPTALSFAFGQGWQAIAAPIPGLPVLPRATTADFQPKPSSFQAGAVPIFQRDCSFLI